MLGDRELASRCADGDALAWDEFVERFERRVLLVFLRAGVAESDCADLRQEVYARLLTHGGAALRSLRGEREGALGAFVAQVALRVAIDHGRSRGTRAKSEVLEDEAHHLSAPHPSPEDAAQLQQGRARFSAELLRAAEGPSLERDLAVLRAYFVDGLNPQELSLMGFGLSVKGCETLVRRARIQIETNLQREVKEK
jgi:RNA polymerase sigma factor (sigma-70 family)